MIFAQLNGYRCQYIGDAAHDELGTVVVALVVHQMSQENIAAWFRAHCIASGSLRPFDSVLQQVLHDFTPTFRFLQDK